MAVASFILSVDELPEALREPELLEEPDKITNKLLPIESIDLLIDC